MRILCVTPYYKPAYIYGGPAHSIPALFEAMARAGASVTVFTTNANGPNRVLDVPKDEVVIVDGVDVVYFPVSKLASRIYPFYSPNLSEGCKSNIHDFNLVYIAGSWTYPVRAGAASSYRHNIPYVISPRGSFMNWSMGEKSIKKHLYLELIERKWINHAATIHVTSRLEEHQLQQWGFHPQVVRIPNGINISPYEKPLERGLLRKKLGISNDEKVTLFVGRLHKEKRLDLIISAFSKIVKLRNDFHLIIVGKDQDGSGMAAQDLVAKLGLSNQVHFVGFLTGSDLAQAYADADLLVLMSHRENFGMVAIEAMAHGLPVLLTKEVGLANEVEEAGAGLVTSSNLEEISASWQKLLLRPDLCKSMGDQGKKLVREQFASDVVATRMIDCFEKILEANSTASRYRNKFL